MKENYDFETWKEVQDREVERWHEELFNYLKNTANVEGHITNWEHVKEMVKGNTDNANVKEEFTFNENEWLEEIYKQIKPYFKEWLEDLLKGDDKEFYTDYVDGFWEGKHSMDIVDFMISSGVLSSNNYVLVEDNNLNINQLHGMGCNDYEIASMRSDEDDCLDIYTVLIKKGYNFSPEKGFYK